MNKLSYIVAPIAILMVGMPFASSAQAGDGPEPVPSRQLSGIFEPDPEGAWRTITQTGATSDCIGELITPMCALDTRLACEARFNNELCKLAEDLGVDNFPFQAKRSQGFYLNYRVIFVRKADESDIGTLTFFDEKSKVRPGDMLIRVKTQSCWPRPPQNDACLTDTIFSTYILRQYGKRWILTNIYTPRE